MHLELTSYYVCENDVPGVVFFYMEEVVLKKSAVLLLGFLRKLFVL